MGYPKELLNDGEMIITDRIPHWSYMFSAASMVGLAILATVVLAFFDARLALVGVLCVLVALIGSFGRFLRWRTTNFVLTTDRLIVRTGIVAKNGLEIPLDRVTNIAYRQSFTERILGVGDLVVESAGDMGHQRFTDVAKPQQLQNLIYKQADLAERSNGAPSNDGSGSNAHDHNQLSVPEQIEKLDELRQRGILSDDEFQQKKQELLGRM